LGIGGQGLYSGNKFKLFSGNANYSLAEEIAEHIGVPLGKGEVSRFSDGEISVCIHESVRGADVFIVQTLSSPANENLMEMLILMDAMKRASARAINAVIPYYCYARQDRKARARDPITAKLVADLLTTAGATRVVTMDLHAGQIQGFFNIPVDHLTGVPILADYFMRKNFSNGIVVSPDMGGVTRARDLAERLKFPIAIIDKRRPKPNVSEVMNLIGEVKDKHVIIIDDIIDTAGTITEGAKALLARGAQEVYACCTHPVLSGPAIERINNSCLKEVVITNAIPLGKEKVSDKITVLSVAPLIGDAIIRIHEELSVSKLFD